MTMTSLLIRISPVLICFAQAPLAQEPPHVATLTGVAAVKDGDGLLFGRVEVRLQGVAAPEQGDAEIGPAATEALREMALGREVTCHLDGTTASSNRPVGVCYVDGLDLGAELVRQGVARDCPTFSGGRYADEEHEAQGQGHDLAARYALPDYC